MASYQILYWKELPSQVKAFDPHGEVKAMLPDSFQEIIDRAAMQAGDFDSDAYLDGWSWSDPKEMPGNAGEVLQVVVEALIANRLPG